MFALKPSPDLVYALACVIPTTTALEMKSAATWDGPILSCPQPCATDEHCPNREKCCKIGCGTTCAPPVFDKAGKCPPVSWRPQISLAKCPDTCKNDHHCKDDEKCCLKGCGHTCVPPYIGKFA
uniref:WAP domain-containing protein n=1 Tax=Gouania willdenowi TaxID=441366 RepID=A0A8C5G022_GOUWI